METILAMTRIISILTLILSILLCFEASGIRAETGKLPDEEVNALKEIAEQLGKSDWDFNLNPCDVNSNWSTPKRKDLPVYNNTLYCGNCSDGVCHVTHIFLKGQDLAGTLPPSLAKLPFITTIDLSRNYLNGTIPPEWASTKLENLYVSVNRLSGPIPEYLGNITTLIYLSLENNRFNGTVPAELGKLINLENLIFIANNLTGELPSELNKLTRLTELRLSGNNFTGRMPSFENWKQLQKLEIQGSGFEGPIHSSISLLSNLNELRISDLTGEGSEFPVLSNMTGMKKLMLRSCNISGKIIRDYIADMAALTTLDLSFNKLEGEIPNLEDLRSLATLYLTGNNLTGPIPDWILGRDARFVIDLSYNNFSESTVPLECRETLNLYKSFSGGKNSVLAKCPSPCSRGIQQSTFSLHVFISHAEE